MKYLSLFSGIGAPEQALKNLGVDYELVGFSEIDKFAVKSYCAVHNVGESLNLGDITKIDIDRLPKEIDLITHGSPCQDYSIAGKNKGGNEGSETRSSLMWNTVEIVRQIKPKYVLWENVKNVLSKKHKPNFDKYLDEMSKAGYKNYYKVLNAKNFGVPQNRERIFVVSIREDIDKEFKFPEEIILECGLNDILEKKVNEKFYLSDKAIEKLIRHKNKIIYNDTPLISSCIHAGYYKMGGRDQQYVKIKKDFEFPEGWDLDKRLKEVLEDEVDEKFYMDKTFKINNYNKIRDVIATADDTDTINKYANKIITHKIDQYVKVRKYPVNIEGLKRILKEAKNKKGLTVKDIANKLKKNKTLVEHWFRQDSCFAIPDADIWMDLKDILDVQTDEFDKSIMEFEIKLNDFDSSNRVYDEKGISPTLTCDSEATAKKILVYKGQEVELPCICASRGRNPENPSSRVVREPTEQMIEINTKGTSNTITSVQKDKYVLVPQATKKGYIEMELGGVCDMTYPDSKTRRGRVQEGGTVCPTLMASTQDLVRVEADYRIRKLTPKECWRLMGFKDEEFCRAQEVCSNSQLYKQAGNSIVVNVLEEIFKKMFLE